MSKKLNKIISLMLSLLMIISLVPTTGITAKADTKPQLVKQSTSIVIGETAKITVKNLPENANVTYKSANRNIATVSKQGKVKGIRSGTTKVTVSVKSNARTTKLTYKITVKKPTISKNKLSLAKGSTTRLSIKNKPKKATYTWSTNNAKVATVNKNGTVKAKGNGTTTISGKVKTAKKTYKLSCKVTVKSSDNPDDEKPTYIVTFNSNGGSPVAPQIVVKNERATKPVDPTRIGYTFIGWYASANGGVPFDFNTVITANITLYAHWNRYNENNSDQNITPTSKTYVITFNSNGGSSVSPQTVAENSKATKPIDPTYIGHTFDGWFTAASGGTLFDFNTAITANVTLYAHWSSNEPSTVPILYTVTFDSNGGSAVNSQFVAENGKAIKPADPTRAEHIFDGWYTSADGGTQFDFNTIITASITLYAHWISPDEDDNTYRISFDRNDGSSSVYQVQRLSEGATVSKPDDPSRDLYRFTGWYTDPASLTEYNFNTPITDDLTLYAGWGNPDGSNNDLYAASDESETIYSISGIEIAENNVIVTYSTNSKCLMSVEFFEDLMSGSNWSETAQNSNLDASHMIATASGYTADYGELITLTLPIEGELPANFVVRATLHGTGTLDPSYVSNQYTATYKEFESQTVDSAIEAYGENNVINFDNDRTTNFGVLKNEVIVIANEKFDGKYEVADVDVPNETVPDHKFVFMDACNEILDLREGQIVYLEGTTWLFKIKTISKSNGTVTMTQDKEATMTDFYELLQVDMRASDLNTNPVGEDGGINTQLELIDVDASLSATLNPLIVNKKFSNGVKLTGSITGSVTGKVKMSYDAHLFSANYFECSITFSTKISTELKASVSNNNTNEWKNVVYQFDTRKIKLPTPVTGLEVYAKPSAKIDWKLSGNVSIKAASNQTSGFKYNSDTGRTDIKNKKNTVSIMAEGSAEFKIGPNLDIGVQFLGGVLSAGITAETGAKVTATAEAGFDNGTQTVDSKHACVLCVSGKAEWYAKATIKCRYEITKDFSDIIASITILDFTAPIYFLPGVPAEFFVSVLNSTDSPFNGHITFGGGSCTNKTYRTEFKATDKNGQQITGIPISVIKQGQTSGSSGTAPYITYLYKGIYKASASFDDAVVSKTFVVSKSPQTVSLTQASADSMLEGSIVDASSNNIIVGALVKVSKDGIIVASAESDRNGNFSVAVPNGLLNLDISKEGYQPFSSVETVYDSETHSVGLIKLTQETGMGGFHGTILDATNGEPIKGVTLNLYEGWNNTAESNTAIKTLTTDEYGNFRYETTTLFGKVHGLPSGNYTLTASKDGYSDASYNIVIYPGTTDDNPSIIRSMSPAMSDGFYRIVLDWGETPWDLDSHLVAQTAESSIHVYYADKDPYPNYANLDRDDTDSYGPETITITNFDGLSEIRYAVHDYTNRGSSLSTDLAYSGATVRLFKGNQLLRTFQVPTGYDGTEWDVFSLNADGEITVINTITYANDPLDVLNDSRSVRSPDETAPLKDYELAEMEK